MIRLIALDMDQTIFGTDFRISDRVRSTIARAQAASVAVTIATGREAQMAVRFARELNITAPIICSQGACIFDDINNRMLHDVTLPMDVLPRILKGADRHGWNINFEVRGNLFFPKESNHSMAIFDLIRYSNWTRVKSLLHDLPAAPTKVVVSLDKTEDRDTVEAQMKDELGDCLTVFPSHPYLVEGTPKNVHKGHGLAWLANHLKIEQADVMAIGDSEADIPMIQWAGVGVAMQNGSDAVKAVADWVAPPLQDDGAAVAMEKFVLQTARGGQNL